MMSAYSVYIIENDTQNITFLRWLLGSMNYKVNNYDYIEEFIKLEVLQHPCCLIVSTTISVEKWVELQKILLSRDCAVPIIIMTKLDEIASCLQAMKAGLFNFLLKPINAQLLLENIKEAVLSDERSFKEQQIRKNIKALFGRLTNREYEILLLLLNNSTSKIIARHINISPNTVDLHRANILKKLQAKSMIDVINLAWCAGIVNITSFSENNQSKHIEQNIYIN